MPVYHVSRSELDALIEEVEGRGEKLVGVPLLEGNAAYLVATEFVNRRSGGGRETRPA